MEQRKTNGKVAKIVISSLLYTIGFVGFCTFLNFAKGVSNEAWWYSVGASASVFLFTTGIYFMSTRE